MPILSDADFEKHGFIKTKQFNGESGSFYEKEINDFIFEITYSYSRNRVSLRVYNDPKQWIDYICGFIVLEKDDLDFLLKRVDFYQMVIKFCLMNP